MGIKDKASETVSKTKRRIGMERPLAAEEGGRVGIVRGALQAFGSGDMDGFLDALKDDAPFECPAGENFPGAGDHEGPDQVKATFIADAGRTYTSFGFQPELFVDSQDQDAVIVFGSWVGEGVEGGSLDTRGVQVWEFKGNTVEAVRLYADSAEFPSVVTEADLKKQEEEDRKAEEEEQQDDDGDGDGDGEAKASSEETETEAKSDSDDDSEDEESDEQQQQQQPQDDTEQDSDGPQLARAGDDQAEAEKKEAQQS